MQLRTPANNQISTLLNHIMTNKVCINCKVDDNIQSFAQCSICNLLTHTCHKPFQNAKVNDQFIKTAEMSGFRYVCSKCLPSLKSFSVTACNIQHQLDLMNHTMLDIIKDIKDLKKGQSEVAKVTSSMPKKAFSDIVKESTLVLTPKDPAMNKERMKTIVRESLNPETSIITSLRSTSGNKIILQSGNSDTAAFANSVKDKLDKDFDVKVSKNDTRQLKLIRFENSGYTNDEIEKAIVSQNVFIDKISSNIKIVKETKYRDNDKHSILIIQLDPKSHKRALDQGYLSIKWKKYKVFDALKVTRCYKCSRLGHIALKCKSNEPICSKCAQPHKVTECQAVEVKCINCIEAMSKFNIALCPNHPSYSLNCPRMLEKLAKLKSAIDRSL